jgi:hypothetical protein
MHRKNLLSCSQRFFVVILTVSVAVSSTQAIVLCTASDGHVAIELAGHHHCRSDHVHQEASHDTGNGVEESGAPCTPCVDIPLSDGVSAGPIVRKAQETGLASAAPLPIPDLADQPFNAFTTTGVCPAFTSFYDPLSSIILIV